jgi:glycosyltransferase involved in cell wall biosynthesis
MTAVVNRNSRAAGPAPKRLRLAVYGYINQGSGSGPASHYLMMRELLRQGHEVDLYAIANFVVAGGLAAFAKCNYLPVAIPWADIVLHQVLLRLPRWLGWIPAQLFNFVRHALYYHQIEALIYRRHREQPYDALLVLDVISPFRRKAGLPIVNWPPGSPLGEWEGIRNCRTAFLRYSSRWLYRALLAYYRVRVALARRLHWRCDQLICASRWTASCWQRLGFPPQRITVIPFCLDLERFSPAAAAAVRADDGITFLHLGRIVPRKRLDLLIEAFRLLRAEQPGVKLLIVGGLAYAQGYRRLLEPGKAPEGLEYKERVPREQIPDLLRRVDVLVQPSENEDFGSAVMEALACGVPVVVGPTNGTGEYGDKAVFPFPHYTTHDLLDALHAATIEIRSNRMALAAAARHAAALHFKPESIAVQLRRLLLDIACRSPAPQLAGTLAAG